MSRSADGTTRAPSDTSEKSRGVPKVDLEAYLGLERGAHSEILYRLVTALGESTGRELHMAYDELAPILYLGTFKTPITRRRRREIFQELEAKGVIASEQAPKGYVWRPVPGGDHA